VAAAEQLLWEAYEGEGIEKLDLAGGGLVSVTEDITVAVENRTALNAWAMANGLGSMMTLYSATVESVTKERLLAGAPLPKGVKVGSYKKTTYRRGKAPVATE